MVNFNEEDGFKEEEGVLSCEKREGGQYGFDKDAIGSEGEEKRHRDIGQDIKEAYLKCGHFVLSESAIQHYQVLMQPP